MLSAGATIQEARSFLHQVLPQMPNHERSKLLSAAFGVPEKSLWLERDLELTAVRRDFLLNAVQRYKRRVPLAYVLGESVFAGRSWKVGPGVLIPRPDTETLLQAVTCVLRSGGDRASLFAPKILDIGTGSGAIALSLALDVADSEVHGWEVSPAALVYARWNQERLGAQRATLSQKDIFENRCAIEFSGCFDVVVSNPPYIEPGDADVQESVRLFEPSQALFSGASGYAHIVRIIECSRELLKPGGLCALEIGWRQASKVSRVFAEHGWRDICVQQDFAGRDRVVMAKT